MTAFSKFYMKDESLYLLISSREDVKLTQIAMAKVLNTKRWYSF
jgi:hypothetical protein